MLASVAFWDVTAASVLNTQNAGHMLSGHKTPASNARDVTA